MLRFQNPRPMGLFDLTALSLSASMIVALSAVASEKPDLPPHANRSGESSQDVPAQQAAQSESSAQARASTQSKDGEHQRAPAAARPSMSRESEDALRGAVSRVNQMMDSASQSADTAADTASAPAGD